MNRSFEFFGRVKNQLSRFSSLRNLTLGMVVIGVILRLIQYSLNRSLWLDECFVALEAVNKSFLELLKPLNYFQITPIGFILTEKAFVISLGNSEYALRLFPLIAGIVSLFLFYHVARRCIREEGALIAVGLFSLSGYLIYYSSEAKQYSSDVTFALLLLAATLYVRSKKFTSLSIVFWGAMGGIAVWFSYTSVFVLAGIGCTLSLFSLGRKEWGNNNKLLITIFIGLLGFFAFYLFYSPSIANTIAKHQVFWVGHFVPFPPMSFSDVIWFEKTFFEVFKSLLNLPLPGLGAFAFLLGAISIFLRDKELFFILLSPVFVVLFASALNIYPFKGRVILFIVPFILLFIGEGVVFLYENTRNYSGVVWILLMGLLFYGPLTNAAGLIINKSGYETMPQEDTRSVMKYLKKHRKQGDVLYLYHFSTYSFKYYSKRYGFSNDDYIKGIYSPRDWNKYLDDLEKLRGNKRVWLMFSHTYKLIANIDDYSDEHFFIEHLNRLGTRLDSFKSNGASVYLYDLSRKNKGARNKMKRHRRRNG